MTNLDTLWSKHANNWDAVLSLCRLVPGVPNDLYRSRAIEALDLSEGDVVLDVATGTGLNLPILQRYVGDTGHIFALDISQGMLNKAEKRVVEQGWSNVSFIHGDVAEASLPKVDAAVACWCMVGIPQQLSALKNMVSALVPEGRLSLLDFRPTGLPTDRVGNFILKKYYHSDIQRQAWRHLDELPSVTYSVENLRVAGVIGAYLCRVQKEVPV